MLYDLELEKLPCGLPGRYVGVTMNVNQRWAQHRKGGNTGAKFCRNHRPVRIVHVRDIPFDDPHEIFRYESEYTLSVMREMITAHGPDAWRVVRGGSMCALNLQRPQGLDAP